VTAEKQTDPNIGRVLENKYEITRALGAGGIGAVYEVHHKLIDRRFALKMLHPEFAQEEEVLERFRREATSTTAIGHPHILEITDMGNTPEGEVFMVMELLHGQDLADLLDDQGWLDPQVACHIAIQILSALEATHAKYIVHRDLKPANVFLIERGGNPHFVKLVDFGISKVRATEEGATKGLTRTGTLLGTPSYMSPEQARGDSDITGASDIYAVGVILYEMLAGRTPFEAPSYVELLMKILSEDIPDPATHRPDLDPELTAIMTRAMAKEIPNRFADAAEFRRALEPFSPETLVPGNTMTPGGGLSAYESGQYHRAGTPGAGSRPGVPAATTPLMLAETVPKTKGGPGRALLFGLGGLLLVAAIAGSLVWLLGGTDEPPAADAPVTTTLPAPAAPAPHPPPPEAEPPAPPEPPAQPAAPAEMVELELEVSPSSAEVTFDGRPLGRGSRGLQLAADGKVYRVEATAAGYKPLSREVTLDSDQTVKLNLERIKSGKRGGGGSAAPAAPTEPAPPAEPAPKPKPKPKSGKRQIDEDEPW